MRWRWEFRWDKDYHSMAEGDDSEKVLAMVFLSWLDGREVAAINTPDSLAGFLAVHSDLSRRELAGLLGTFRFSTPDGTQLEFKYQDESVQVVREQVAALV